MPIIYNSGIFGQPAQALPTDEKQELWKRANLDWMEQLLKSHLPEKQKKLSKNYNMAQGVIDVTDYIDVEDNEFKGLLFDSKLTFIVDTKIQFWKSTKPDKTNYYPVGIHGNINSKLDSIQLDDWIPMKNSIFVFVALF